MSVYLVTLLSVAVLCGLAQKMDYKSEQSVRLERIRHSQPAKIFFGLAVLILICVSGLRYFVGTDYGAYYRGAAYYADEFWEKLRMLDEPGIRLIYKVAGWFSSDPAVSIFFCAAFTVFLMLRMLFRNTRELLVAMLLFIFLGCWHGAFNGVRQYMAAAVLFCGYPYLYKKRFLKYLFVVFLAFLFHRSAIVMIFPYFIAKNKVNVKNILLLAVGCTAVLLSYDIVFSFAGTLLDETYSQEYGYFFRSVNALRILVACAPAVYFAFIFWNKPKTEKETFYLNLLIMNAVTMVVTSQSAYLARMGIYTATFSSIGIAELLKRHPAKTRSIVRAGIVLLFAAYWLYDIMFSRSLRSFHWIWERSI